MVAVPEFSDETFTPTEPIKLGGIEECHSLIHCVVECIVKLLVLTRIVSCRGGVSEDEDEEE